MRTIGVVVSLVILMAAGGGQGPWLAAATRANADECGEECAHLAMPDDGGTWARVGDTQFVVADIGADRGCFFCGIEQQGEMLTRVMQEGWFAGQFPRRDRVVYARFFDPAE